MYREWTTGVASAGAMLFAGSKFGDVALQLHRAHTVALVGVATGDGARAVRTLHCPVATLSKPDDVQKPRPTILASRRAEAATLHANGTKQPAPPSPRTFPNAATRQ